MNTPIVKAIDGRSVHQICSGQVVVTLSTAVKELVENSLDAGASNIEIRLKNFGADSLEVVDNGSGVLPENFHALALKHHTSKLNLFSDLAGVETFGFRGEALSSLCALSDLSITTCHISKNIGARIEYDHDGNITNQTAIARVSGTTVTLQNLFSTLPVRHKEFLRNLKREYAKLVQVLQSYCVICSGIRLSCYTHSEKGKKNLVLSTNGNPDMRENISNVFGPKQLQTLLEFKQVAPTKEDCQEQGLDISRLDDDPVFNLTGFVSRCDHRAGRSTTDRQYIFINKRPCDLPKVVRLVNEAYHAFNRNQYPFLALNISLSKELVDVNVTPDKRQVFLQQEKLLLATIRTSLKCLFDPDVSSYALNEQPFDHVKLGVNNLKGASISSFSKSIKDRLLLASESSRKKFGSILDYANRKERNAIVENDVLHNEDDLKYDSEQNCNSVKENVGEVNANTEDVNGENENYQNANYEKANEENTPCKCVNDDNTIGLEANCKNANGENADGENAYTENADSEKANGDDRNSFNRNRDNGNSLLMNHSAGTTEDTDPNDPFRRVQGKIEELPDFFERIGSVEDQCTPEHTDIKNRYRYKRRAKELKRKLEASEEDRLNREGREPSGNVKKIKLEEEYGNLVDTTNRKSITVEFNWKKLLTQCAKRDQKQIGHVTRTFRATIAPENNQKAEDELRRHITKEMFGQMEIIGQFNQGFIVSKLKDDLFIIDQHASDEKYHFEEQQKNTIIKSQRLISPQELDLTAVNESILIENIEVFQKNGFGVEIDEEAPVSKRVKLVSLPVSRNWSFGKSDIDELIFMLSDSPGVCYRPSNVRKMFASRACRMSIMVGTALNTTQMRRIVGHMGEMEHPWNCPHGRPTMRHLINLNMIRK